MSPGQRQDHVPAAATGARPAPSAASAAPAAPSRQDEVSPPVSRPGPARFGFFVSVLMRKVVARGSPDGL